MKLRRTATFLTNTNTHKLTHTCEYMCAPHTFTNMLSHSGRANERVALHDSTSKWVPKGCPALATGRSARNKFFVWRADEVRAPGPGPDRDDAASCLIARRDKCRERVLPNLWSAPVSGSGSVTGTGIGTGTGTGTGTKRGACGMAEVVAEATEPKVVEFVMVASVVSINRTQLNGTGIS